MQSCRFFVVVLVVMEHFYHLFACHQIKKKLPRSFKMGSPLYYIPLLQKEIFSHRHWTHYKTDDDSSMQYYFMKCILLQHFDFTQLWLQAMSRTCQKTPFILPTTKHLGPSLPNAFTTKFHSFATFTPFLCQIHYLDIYKYKYVPILGNSLRFGFIAKKREIFQISCEKARKIQSDLLPLLAVYK